MCFLFDKFFHAFGVKPRVVAFAAVLIAPAFADARPVFAQAHRGIDPLVLTMQSAVTRAIENNPTLKAQRFDRTAAEADQLTAGLRQNPSLTINADILPSDGLGIAEKNYGISLAVPIELGGKRDARLAAADAAISVTELQYRDAIRTTTFGVRSAFIDLAVAAARAEAYSENVALLDSLVALSEIRVRDKDIASVELTRSEVERDRVQLEALRLQEAYRAAQMTLGAFMGASREESRFVADPALVTNVRTAAAGVFPSLDSLVAIAERSRSDIQLLRAAEREAEANRQLQASLASIDLTVSLDYFRSQQITYYGSTLSIPLPIFNRNQGEIAKADVRNEQAHAQTNAALVQLRADVTNAYYDALNKQHALVALDQNVLGKSREVRAAVEYAYRRGGTSLVDFLDAARTYNELQQSYVEALGDFAKSLVQLNATLGTDFFTFS